MPEWGALGETTWTDPLLLRAVAAVAGLVLLLVGARVYQLALKLSAFMAGVLGVMAALYLLAPVLPVAAEPAVAVVGGLAGGVVVMLATLWVHRLALVAVGAVTGALVGGAAASVLGAAWWAPLVGAAGGAVLVPLLFPVLLTVVTPLVGALGLAWAAGAPDDLRVIGGLWFVGACVQVGLFGRGARREPDEEGD